jgi:hypothetical protein
MIRKLVAGIDVAAGALMPVKEIVNVPTPIALTDATPFVAVEPVTPDTGVKMIIEFGVTIDDVTACETAPDVAAVRTTVPVEAPPAEYAPPVVRKVLFVLILSDCPLPASVMAAAKDIPVVMSTM